MEVDKQQKDSRAADVLYLLFRLKRQRLVSDYSCAISDQILMHGRMYITDDAVCFFSAIFGKEIRKILPFDRVHRVTCRNVALVLPALEFTMELRSGGRKKILFMSFFANSRDDCFRICDQLHRQHRPELFTAEGAAAAAAGGPAEARPAPRTLPDGGSLSGRSATSGAEAGILSLAVPQTHGRHHHHPPLPHASMTPLGTSARRIRAVTAGGAVDPVPLERASFSDLPAGPASAADGDAEAARRASLSAAVGRRYRGRRSSAAAEDAGALAAPTAAAAAAGGEASSSGGSSGSPPGRPVLGAIEEQGSGDRQLRRYRGSTGDGSDGGHSGGASSAALTFRDDGIAPDDDEEGEGEEGEEGGASGDRPPAESVPAVAWQSLPPVSPSLWARVGRMKVLLDVVLPLSPTEFHEHCLAETAGFSVAAMHRAKKHFDLTCSPWTETVAAADEGDAAGRRDVFVTRTLRFTMALDPMPFTPKQTSVEKVQRYSQFAGPLLAVESSTRSLNVPYGDYFTTEEMWVVGDVGARFNIAKHEAAAPADVAAACAQVRERLGGALRGASDEAVRSRCCRFVLATYVNFSKSTILRGQIASQSERGTAQFFASLPADLVAYLQQQQQQQQVQQGSASSPGTPVRPSGGRRKSVAPADTQGGGSVSGRAAAAPVAPSAAADPGPESEQGGTGASPSFLPPSDAAAAAPGELLRHYTQLHGAYVALEARMRQAPSPPLSLPSPGTGAVAAVVEKLPPQTRTGLVSSVAKRMGLEMESASLLLGAFCGVLLAAFLLFAVLLALWLFRDHLTEWTSRVGGSAGTPGNNAALVADLWARIEDRLDAWAARQLHPPA